ncbi:hypothetical protein [Paractinoplanes rishiriensis]|uniref:Lipoprotein n=1 Tax=Paractinoplanes rishiriensis TaxID=1050105 RepID=A0A919MVV3_9ACTN|nr:hypothetical protein [Actinoplanes rishiriensis]GIF01812.1 hypothetical protein Ari01nite_92760 [Actinoplanes rishiriensis]
MRPRALVSAAALLVLAVAACGGPAEREPADPTVLPPAGGDGGDARADLAARAALALDKSYAALYTLDDDGSGRQHHVVATIAADGTWRVDVSGGAHGGATDVSIVSIKSGVYQCTVATATNPINPTCVRVAAAGKRVPKAYDPQVERLFRQWLGVFTDRQAAISVAEVEPLRGAQGSCYSIDSISASLKAPVDIGIYCYANDGVLTAARVGFGVLTIVSQAAGPATVQLPGPDVGGQPMPTEAPPPPPPAVEPSGSTPPA